VWLLVVLSMLVLSLVFYLCCGYILYITLVEVPPQYRGLSDYRSSVQNVSLLHLPMTQDKNNPFNFKPMNDKKELVYQKYIVT
jgi:hypothetical protein